MPLNNNDIEAELSYAYLHAVSAHAGFACEIGGRHSDNAGVDARIHARGDFGGPRTDITLNIQLKATCQIPTETNDKFSYSLTRKHYDKLRSIGTECQQLLVVLFLPENAKDWLAHSTTELALRRCAYWISLRGAPASMNDTSQVIYLPKVNLLTVSELKRLIVLRSQEEYIPYAP